MRLRLLIKILTRETQVVGERTEAARVLVRQRGAERIAVPLPDQQVVLVDYRARRVELIRLDPEHFHAAYTLQQINRV